MKSGIPEKPPSTGLEKIADPGPARHEKLAEYLHGFENRLAAADLSLDGVGVGAGLACSAAR
jgi:hypothetical protein